MKINNTYKMKFMQFFSINMLIISIMMALSSPSWLLYWISMEINMLCFIPLLFNKINNNKAMMKYFIIQTFASSIFLLCCFINMYQNWSNIIIIMTMLMKLGMFPFNSWFIEISEMSIWPITFLLFTIQKIIPLSLSSQFLFSQKLFINMIIMLNMFYSSISMLWTTSLKKILALSSINHTSWMMFLMFSEKSWLLYWMIYSLISFFGIYFLNKNKINYLNQTFNKTHNMSPLILFFFNLSSIPPFLGFFLKWYTLNLILNQNYLTIFIMILSTIITSFFYMRCIFIILCNWKLNMSTFKTKTPIYFMSTQLFLILITPELLQL